MKIIDFEKFGNTVRFFLGTDDCENYWGDDWDNIPYDHNAGAVYTEYIEDTATVYFDFDDVVLEPCESDYNDWSKLDMKNGAIPCIVVVPDKVVKEYDYEISFDRFASSNNKNIKKYYFGDVMVPGTMFITKACVMDFPSEQISFNFDEEEN